MKEQTKIAQLEYDVLKLKGSVYDRIAQVEYHNAEIGKLKEQMNNINIKITEIFKELERERNKEKLEETVKKAKEEEEKKSKQQEALNKI